MNVWSTLSVGAAMFAASHAALAGGACTASLDDGTLVVECDSAANDVTVTQVGAEMFEVIGNNGTLIDGLSGWDTYTDGGGNVFDDGLELLRIEAVIN